MSCPFAAPGRQEACLSLQKQRDALMTREYDRNECYACPMRRKRLEGAQEPERIAVPPAQFNPNAEPIQPKKEGAVDQEKVKENILRVLGRKGRMTISNLKLFAAADEAKENFHAIVDALVGEGKVVKEAGPREGSFAVMLPGATARVSPPNDATVPSKRQRKVNRRQSDISLAPATAPSKTRAKPERPVPAPREPVANNKFAAVIADLEARRGKIDQAIETLRALA